MCVCVCVCVFVCVCVVSLIRVPVLCENGSCILFFDMSCPLGEDVSGREPEALCSLEPERGVTISLCEALLEPGPFVVRRQLRLILHC